MSEPITEAEDQAIEDWSWRTFAQFHPQEAYATWPERFLAFVQELEPRMTAEQLERNMKTL